MATDVSKVIPYTPSRFPTLPDGERAFFTAELRSIAQSIVTIQEALVKLETRIVALGG